MTTIINMLGGPGTGKSTVAASVFARLKRDGVHCEFVSEYAKELVYESRMRTLTNQIHVFGEQLHRIWICAEQVDVVVMDTSLLNSIIYGPCSDEFARLIISEFFKMDNLVFSIYRDVPYSTVGRYQTEKEAEAVDVKIQQVMEHYNVPGVVLPLTNADKKICDHIKSHLG